MVRSRDFVRLANRVELSANFAGSATDKVASRNAFGEAVSSTLVMLDQLDPVWLSEALQFPEDEFFVVANALSVDAVWTRFLAERTDGMHQIGVHQKAIARLGTMMDQWKPVLVTQEQMITALLALADTLSESEVELYKRLLPAENEINQVFQLANLLYGMALIGAAVEDRANLKEKYPVFACSNAQLVIDSVDVLQQRETESTVS